MPDMRRRQVISLLGSLAAAWPVTANAQRAEMPLIGFLGSASPDAFANRLRSFRQGLSEVGYVEGQNLGIEFRWANNQLDRLPALAADLVRRGVTIIAAPGSTAAASAAKAATTNIPIVFYVAVDPIVSGLVASLSRPGGNLTGVTNLQVELGPKQVELMHEMVPTAKNIALLVNPTNQGVTEAQVKTVQAAAYRRGLELYVVTASTENDIDSAFAALVELKAAGLLITSDAFFTSRIDQLCNLSLQHAIPAIYQFREFAAAGGLATYGGSNTEAYRQAGVYTGRILKGENAAELPVHQVTKVELAINLKTAKALSLTVPEILLARADEVIE